MTRKEQIDNHLFTVPHSMEQLLVANQYGLSDDADPNAIVVLSDIHSPIDMALEALAQANQIVSRKQSQGATGELESLILDTEGSEAASLARTNNLEAALMRRALARKGLIEASIIYDNNYQKDKNQRGDRIVRQRSTDLILDLYDRTEQFDETPVLSIVEQARNLTKKDSVERQLVNEADTLLRIMFAGEVKIDILEEDKLNHDSAA